MRRATKTVATWLGISAGIAGLVISRYRRDLRAAQARLQDGRRVIETACGPVEYGASRAGQPVLVSTAQPAASTRG